MMSELNSGEIDVAIALTEGVITKMLDPNFDVEIVSGSSSKGHLILGVLTIISSSVY